MGIETKISWTDSTFNPWIGCAKVSPGCKNCYAETLDTNRFAKMMDGGTKDKPVGHWGKGAPRHLTHTWGDPVKWNALPFWECAGCGHRGVNAGPHGLCAAGCGGEVRSARRRVFCASLADWLDNEVPIEWLARLMKLVHDTPELDWQLLTKRPQNWRKRVAASMRHLDAAQPADARPYVPGMVCAMLDDWLHDKTPPENVWLGTSVEDQQRADERIPALLAIPARVRFLSCEPLLGPVDLEMAMGEFQPLHPDLTRKAPPVQWVVAGGESGKHARPMHSDWARNLRDQCQVAGAAFHFKQWGEWLPDNQNAEVNDLLSPASSAIRVGKINAGRLLDGREWNGFPREVPA